MKKILFVRHGKAESASWEVDDLDRTLTDQGKYDTEMVVDEISKRLELDGQNTFLVVSDAKRTCQSAAIYESKLALPKRVCNIWKNLYGDYTTSEFVEYVAEKVPNEYDNLIVVGHNPTLSDIVNQMAIELDCWMSTSSCVCLAFDMSSWSDLEARSAELYFSLFPSEIR
ncbi:histidine phosphatase family protein [Halosquirtibacter xylanolyticus]|uniref:SixA phosphatase family protein n=1 Tax=Halosquirtibacter xylanolyticus TaxID=3374599 RepID=UPI0037499BC6|nr:histidine phosphatase family protein [Prolixibacteraceae bacterium]